MTAEIVREDNATIVNCFYGFAFMGINQPAGPFEALAAYAAKRFVDLTNAYDAALIERVITAGRENGDHIDTGVYGGVSGPSFETPAGIQAI